MDTMTPNPGKTRITASDYDARKAGVINLAGGFAAPHCLPDLQEEVLFAAGAARKQSLQYGDRQGAAALRQAIAGFVRDDGIVVDPDDVLIVNGAKHGLDLVCRAVMDAGDAVIVSAPTYMGAISIFDRHKLTYLNIPRDSEGMSADILSAELDSIDRAGGRKPRLLYEMPDFHNPTATTTSAARRAALVALAKRHRFTIVEDDPYRRLQFDGAPVQALKAFDDAGVVLSLGTASKVMAPGFRIGWALGERRLLARMAQFQMDGGANPFGQQVFARFLSSGRVASHIAGLAAQMKVQRDAMVTALRLHIPEARHGMPAGGYYLWTEFPGVDADELAGSAAAEGGVEVYAGSLSYGDRRKAAHLRLCYSLSKPVELEEGIARLATVYRSLRQRSRSG
jgi:2-aminoadipate transaminase